MKQVIICHDKIMKTTKEYDAVKFLDPCNTMGNDCSLKPNTPGQARNIITSLLDGGLYQNSKVWLSLRSAIPARVFLEIEGGILTYVAQDREEIEVYLIDWDNAQGSDATEEDKETMPGATMAVFKNEQEVQDYIRRTRYVEDGQDGEMVKDSNDMDDENFGSR